MCEIWRATEVSVGNLRSGRVREKGEGEEEM